MTSRAEAKILCSTFEMFQTFEKLLYENELRKLLEVF